VEFVAQTSAHEVASMSLKRGVVDVTGVVRAPVFDWLTTGKNRKKTGANAVHFGYYEPLGTIDRACESSQKIPLDSKDFGT
jgi:hypothetical protein